MLRLIVLSTLLAWSLTAPMPVMAQEDVADITPREGWIVEATPHDFDTLVARLDEAVAANNMAVVTRAGPTGAAASRGVTIPGNMVVGVFNNRYAVRILGLSTHAMIHAPIRFYITENGNGTASLSYILPSVLLAPYIAEAGADLSRAAAELDTIFATIAQAAAAG